MQEESSPAPQARRSRFWVLVYVPALLASGLALGWFGTLWAMPRLAFHHAAQQFSAVAGENRLIHFIAADAGSMPAPGLSPDFLYSACLYDLSAGAVELRMPVPARRYWSASFYAAGQGQFFTVSVGDLVAGRPLWLEIARAGSERQSNAPQIAAPARRGIVLLRLLREKNPGADKNLDLLRREGFCRPLRQADASG